MIGRRVYAQSRCACGLGLCVVQHIGVSVINRRVCDTHVRSFISSVFMLSIKAFVSVILACMW